MRILYLTALNLDAQTGAIEHVHGIVGGLTGLGHQVSLVALGEAPIEDPTRILIPPSGSWTRRIKLMRRAVEAATSGDKTPDVVYVRSFPLDYMLLLHRVAKRKIPFVLELNTLMSQEYRTERKRLRAIIYGAAERPSLAASAGWLGVTNEILEDARRKVPTSRPSALALNGFFPYLGEPIAACDARFELGISPDARILVMASFGQPWHGADRALAMLHHLPPAVGLWLVGPRNKNQTEDFLRLADPAVRSRVRFWPWLSGRDFALILAAADLGLGPLALDRNDMTEAQPMKVRTYLGAGLPVLLNYLDPALEGAGRFVQRVESSDPARLAEAALAMLQLSPAERKNAAVFAKQNLTWEAAARSTAAFVERVLAGSRQGSVE